MFGQKDYVLTVLRDVEDKVRRNRTLRFKFPWFDEESFGTERDAAQIRLAAAEKLQLENAHSVLHGYLLGDVDRSTSGGRQPPTVRNRRLARAALRGEPVGCILQSAQDAVGQRQGEILRQLLANGGHHLRRSCHQVIDDGLCGSTVLPAAAASPGSAGSAGAEPGRTAGFREAPVHPHRAPRRMDRFTRALESGGGRATPAEVATCEPAGLQAIARCSNPGPATQRSFGACLKSGGPRMDQIWAKDGPQSKTPPTGAASANSLVVVFVIEFGCGGKI